MRVVLLLSLMGAVIGCVIGVLVTPASKPCIEPAICIVDQTRGPGCLPGPCHSAPTLPYEVWIGGMVGLLLGFAVAWALVQRRTRSHEQSTTPSSE